MYVLLVACKLAGVRAYVFQMVCDFVT